MTAVNYLSRTQAVVDYNLDARVASSVDVGSKGASMIVSAGSVYEAETKIVWDRLFVETNDYDGFPVYKRTQYTRGQVGAVVTYYYAS